MRYFSTFSGIGGFELGIQLAYDALFKEEKKRIGTQDAETVRSERDQSHNETDERLGGSGTEPQQHHINSTVGQPTCVGFSEIDKYAIQIYEKHFPNHTNYGDITKINADALPDFDLFVGGFPCQAFSVAGKRKGFDDTRGTLFFDIARILRTKQPRLLLLENVKGLLSHDNGKTFSTIISTLDELGYDLQWQVLNSKNHGVPQNRERVFIVGNLRGTSRPQVFPFGESNSTHLREITSGVSDAQRIYKIDGLAKTLKGLGGGLGAKTGMYQWEDHSIRRLTPTECERLQGFPDGWTLPASDSQRYKMCGNAVTVNVVRDICEKLLPS